MLNTVNGCFLFVRRLGNLLGGVCQAMRQSQGASDHCKLGDCFDFGGEML
jgi:hypothetical protein